MIRAPGKCEPVPHRAAAASRRRVLSLVLGACGRERPLSRERTPDALPEVALADLPKEARELHVLDQQGRAVPLRPRRRGLRQSREDCCRRSRAATITSTRCARRAQGTAAAGAWSAAGRKRRPTCATTATTTINRSGRSAHEAARSPRPGNRRRPRVARRRAGARRRGGTRRSCASSRPTSRTSTARPSLLAALAQGLKLPTHFGNNWDALADSVEDGEWLGQARRRDRALHTAAYRKAHGIDWTKLEDILAEAVRLLARAAQAVLGLRLVACAAMLSLPHKIPVSTLVARPHAGPARAADRARRCAGLLAVGDGQPGGRRNAGETASASSARKPESTPRLYGGLATGRYRTSTRSIRAGAIAMRRERRTIPSTCSRCRCPAPVAVTLEPREHRAYVWLPWQEAAAKCFSWSNRDAIRAASGARCAGRRLSLPQAPGRRPSSRVAPRRRTRTRRRSPARAPRP